MCYQFHGCDKCLGVAAWAGKRCLEPSCRGCHPWVSRPIALGSRRGRMSPLQEHEAKAEWDQDPGMHWKPVSSDHFHTAATCNVQTGNPSVDSATRESQVHRTQSHPPNLSSVEYLTYSKYNRVPGQAGQPTIFTNMAKKEQKGSEFGG